MQIRADQRSYCVGLATAGPPASRLAWRQRTSTVARADYEHPLLPRSGHDFAAPRRRDDSGWATVAAVLAAGLRYEGFQTCGCGREPKFRPRTKADVRAGLRVAERKGVPESEALAARDPYGLT